MEEDGAQIFTEIFRGGSPSHLSLKIAPSCWSGSGDDLLYKLIPRVDQLLQYTRSLCING